MVVRLAPKADRKKSNLWKFLSYSLGESTFQEGMLNIFMNSQHLRGVLSQAHHLAHH